MYIRNNPHASKYVLTRKLAHIGIASFPAVAFNNTCANKGINHVTILLKHVERNFSYVSSSIKE